MKNLLKNKIFIVGAAVLLAIILFVAGVVIAKTSGNAILSGVSVAGIDVSSLTLEEAETALRTALAENEEKEITITAGDDTFKVKVSDLGAHYDFHATAQNAVAFGRIGFSVGKALKSFFGVKQEVAPVVVINDRMFNDLMAENTDFDPTCEASYELKEDGIYVTNGKNAYTINPSKAKAALRELMATPNASALTFSKENIEHIPFNLAEVENKGKEAVSATYYRDSEGEIRITEGYDYIELDKAEAQKIIDSHNGEGESYVIPAKVQFADHTTKELEEALFRDHLSSYETSYATSNAARSHNVALAASSINEKILLPGEKLSYNEALGKRTPEAGYQLAGAYSNGQTVQEYGGGICQVSSTLYNAVLKANLKIEERLCHMFAVGYVPMGLDATVDWGTVDFIFSNDTEYPIKVVCITTPSKKVICDIYGTKVENFEVEMLVTGFSSIPYEVEEVEDPTLPVGETKVTEKGSNGARCSTYRIVKIDGVEVSRTLETTSYYMAHKEIVSVGTMVTEGEVSPETETPEAPIVPETPIVPEVPEEPAITPVEPEDSSVTEI